MEFVREEHSTTEIFPAVVSGMIRLSPKGLWEGQGTYESPVVDLGEIWVFSGVAWQSIEEFGTYIDINDTLPKTIQVRYHDYAAPVRGDHGLDWNNEESPHTDDPGWGKHGSIEWIDFENGATLASGIDIRYIQWRARLVGN
jgi:hypothetical protein